MWTRIETSIPLSNEVKSVLMPLILQGFQAYVVGGAVRSFLLGKQPYDFDVATNATPDQVLQIFPNGIEVGRAFGTIKIPMESGALIEVTTFRQESGYSDHRHPNQVQFSDLDNDAKRRDFTVNAFYYDHKQQLVFDAFQGLNDLKEKRLRCIGDARDRFSEDALRLLRLVRFSSQLEFSIETETENAAKECADWIRKVSIERIRDEVQKILSGDGREMGFGYLHKIGLLRNLFPTWVQDREVPSRLVESVQRHLAVCLKQNLNSDQLWAMTFLPWIRTISLDQREIALNRELDRWKFSNEKKLKILFLIQESQKLREVFRMRDATLFRVMLHLDFQELLQFHKAECMATDGNLATYHWIESKHPEVTARAALPKWIGGEDLQSLGIPPGKEYSRILSAIEDLILEGKIPDKKTAIEVALKIHLDKK